MNHIEQEITQFVNERWDALETQYARAARDGHLLRGTIEGQRRQLLQQSALHRLPEYWRVQPARRPWWRRIAPLVAIAAWIMAVTR